MASVASLPLPRGWSKVVHRGVLHAISVAATALTHAWSRTASSRSRWQKARAEADRLRTGIALWIGELELEDTRWARVPARRRPHYGPVQRMRILELRASRGWSTEQTANRLLVPEETIVSWMRTLDEGGEAGLVQMGEPVNKFPQFVAYLVRRLKRTCPTLGKTKIGIAIVERFIRSMNAECTGRIVVPYRLAPMRSELGCYATWYNEHRPHEALGGRTPNEVFHRLLPAHARRRYEPRPRWPSRVRCAAPVVPADDRLGLRPTLVVGRFERRAHLPVVELRQAGWDAQPPGDGGEVSTGPLRVCSERRLASTDVRESALTRARNSVDPISAGSRPTPLPRARAPARVNERWDGRPDRQSRAQEKARAP